VSQSKKMSFQIPPGLTQMLQDFTVAVLRNKPPDLYKFAADHFAKLYAEKSGGAVPGSPDGRKDSRKSKDAHAGFASPGSKADSKAASDMSSRDPSPGMAA